ncbi:LysR family transcriptional regulator [Streptomyces mayteni]
MDARQLEYFLAIVEHGGFSRAAAALHVAQPSLSQSMANLEAELGVALFHRVGRGAVLSAAGAELLGPSRQVLRDLAAVRDTAAALRGRRRGTVEIATMPSPGIEPLTTLVRAFAARHPGLTVSARAAFTPDEVLALVRDGACEVGLLGSATRVHAPGLTVLELAEQPFAVVAPPDGPFEDGVEVEPARLAGRALIASRPGSLMRSIVDDILASVADTRVAAVVDHRTSILPLVLAGVGVAVLPSAWIPLARRCGAVAAPIAGTARLRVALVARPTHLTPAADAFLRVAASHRPDL